MRRLPLKFLALLVVFLVLMFLLSVTSGLVNDRQRYRHIAMAGIAQGMAGPQALLGPIITQRCTHRWVAGATNDEKAQNRLEETRGYIAPEHMAMQDAALTLTPLKRGLFTANTFSLKGDINARFAAQQLSPKPLAQASNATVMCDSPQLLLAVGDARGIRAAQVFINEQPASVLAGTGLEQAASGIRVDLSPWLLTQDSLPALQVRVQLELTGTQALAVAPVADDTQVSLRANWPHPAFGGHFLPTERDVRADGFAATWRVSSLASNGLAQLADGHGLCLKSSASAGQGWEQERYARGNCLHDFDVRFIDPVDPYTMSERAHKYGLLFVVLTFVAVGLIEVLRQLRVHPVQYALVGSALLVFFLLLLGLSEHLPFALAYGLAASACVLLLTYYASHVLKSWRLGLPFGAGVAVLYGLLYTLLQLEQNALLVGSLALFAVLALLMWATRRVDWYALGALDAMRPRREAAPPTPPQDGPGKA